jgi:hypothetical protein
MEKPKKRRPGRPSLGKRGNFTFRVRENIRERLIASAESSNVSVSEEIERRIEQSFSHASVIAEMFGGEQTARLMFTFAVAIQEAERVTGKNWWADEGTFETAKVAIDSILASYDFRKKRELAETMGRWGSLAELGARHGPFIDHFSIGMDAAALAMAKAQLAARNVAEAPAEEKENQKLEQVKKPKRHTARSDRK